MNEIKINSVLSYINSYAKEKYRKGDRKTRELFPSFDNIAKYCNITLDDVRLAITILEKNGEIIRYTSQRYLKWVWEKLNQKTNEKDVYTNEKKKYNFDILYFFLLLEMSIVGIFTIYISIDFTFLWFINILSSFQSMILSTAIVLSGINFFILFSFSKKKQNQITFLIISIIIISFSITTGVSGQLNRAIEKKIKNDKIELQNNNEISLYEFFLYENSQIQKDIDSVRKEKKDLQLILKKLINQPEYSYNKDSDRNLYNVLDQKIVYKNKYLETLKKRKEKYKEEIQILLKKEKIKINISKKIDFFDWLESIFTTIKADIWRFILYLILAIFVDIISPINFSIVFNYIRKKYEKKDM